MSWYSYKQIPSAAEKKKRLAATIAKSKKKDIIRDPIQIEGKTIALTFWGKAWCNHLESYSDFESRLPRGRTYVRNGSVIDLKISSGRVRAEVMGSFRYKIEIRVDPISTALWTTLKKECAGQISSLLALLQGQLPDEVMERMTRKENGLFPTPKEIHFDCDCPDWATMCKHVAAALYGVGSRLDRQPELLFLLRGVDHKELIESVATASTEMISSKESALDESDLASIFGIDLAPQPPAAKIAPKKTTPKQKKSAKSKTSPRKSPAKKKPPTKQIKLLKLKRRKKSP